MCVVHAFYRRPFPGAQSHSQLRVRSEGQICPPDPLRRRPALLEPGGCAVEKQRDPRLPAVAPLHPARRLTRRTRPGGPGPSRAPGEPVPSNPSPRRRARTLSSRPQAPVPFSHLSPTPRCPTLSWVLPVRSQPCREWPWSRCAVDQARFCVGCLAWEGWGAHLACGGPSHPAQAHVA